MANDEWHSSRTLKSMETLKEGQGTWPADDKEDVQGDQGISSHSLSNRGHTCVSLRLRDPPFKSFLCACVPGFLLELL